MIRFSDAMPELFKEERIALEKTRKAIAEASLPKLKNNVDVIILSRKALPSKPRIKTKIIQGVKKVTYSVYKWC